jgi:hypothetical protein
MNPIEILLLVPCSSLETMLLLQHKRKTSVVVPGALQLDPTRSVRAKDNK